MGNRQRVAVINVTYLGVGLGLGALHVFTHVHTDRTFTPVRGGAV